MKPRAVYVYLVEKSKFPKKVKTLGPFFESQVFVDFDVKTRKAVGYEVLSVYEVEIDGRKV